MVPQVDTPLANTTMEQSDRSLAGGVKEPTCVHYLPWKKVKELRG